MSWFIRYPACIVYFLAIFTTTCNAQSVTSAPIPGIVFPDDNQVLWRTVSSAIHLLGVSILAYCLARRTDKFSARGFTSIPIARWLVILIFVDSWLFLFAAGLLISGVGLSLNSHACDAGIFLCIVLYAISKILIYWFLVEKVHLVHPHPNHSRRKSPAYRLCSLFVIGYGVIIIIAIHSRISYIRDGHQIAPEGTDDHGNDGSCIIGLGRAGSMSVLVYDLLLNVFFTCMFLYPLYKSTRISTKLRAIAKRTLIASSVALITSAVNMCIMTVMHGQQLGWICLASCGADVAINAVAIYSVTASVDDHNSESDEDDTLTPKDRQAGLSKGLGQGIKHMMYPQKPHLPTANSGNHGSGRGILERKIISAASDIPAGTRSVHFSAETTRQSRGFVADNGSTLVRSERTLSDSIFLTPQTGEDDFNVNEGTASFFSGDRHIPGSQIEPPDVEKRQPRVRPTIITALPPLNCQPVEPSEETSVEVRHEGPLVRKASRRASIVSMGSTASRKRSKSVDASERESSHCRVISLSHAPSTVDEARERIHVLSALTEIAGEKRNNQMDQTVLEVSVVTQTDRRIEVRKKPPRNDMFDDYHSPRHNRPGNSFSSSGGL